MSHMAVHLPFAGGEWRLLQTVHAAYAKARVSVGFSEQHASMRAWKSRGGSGHSAGRWWVKQLVHMDGTVPRAKKC